MSESFTYQQYVRDEQFLKDYNEYQAHYASRMRESDRVLLDLVKPLVESHESDGGRLRLLDIGCSTGNLLLHIKRAFPGVALTGGDLAESSLAQCRSNPELAGVEFSVLDVTDLPAGAGFDVITVNAVLYMMTDEQFSRALRSLARALRAGGSIIVFDFFHPFEQDLSIMEISRSHPGGLRLRFRRMTDVAERLHAAGFEAPAFHPFILPIDLPRHADDSQLITYTVPTADGRRLPFRGTLFQPWCYLIARIAA